MTEEMFTEKGFQESNEDSGIYRLTLRTVDGTRYISDYDNKPAASMKGRKFTLRSAERSYCWREGNIQVCIVLDTVSSFSIQRLDTDDIHGPTFIGTICIEEGS